ncbi:MAG: BatD family protein [Spirosomataceae bacterium]
MKHRNRYILFLIFFPILTSLRGQVAENPFSVEFSGTQITMQEPFTISVKVTGLEQIPTISFPDNIKSFQKRESSRSSYTGKIAGVTTVTYTVSQNYYPTKTGTFNTGSLEILVNKQVLRSEGTFITVQQSSDNGEVTEEFSEITPELEKEANESVFLAVSVNKRRVYVEEGFNLRLSLLISENNATEMDFFEVEKQLEKILKVLKPANCWEESFGIQEIPAIPITIGDKNFTEYRIYQASFFPLNNQSIRIPEVKLTMKVMPKSEAENTTSTLQTFQSKPLTISVIELPPHPLRNQVIVGNFRLEEKISHNQLETGKSYRYHFRIIGEGNIQSIQEPTFTNKALFDVYPPDIEKNVLRQKGRIVGEKTFQYQIIPKQNGSYALDNMIFWVYFNPQKQSYDTLHSTLKLTVKGENITSTQLASEPESVFTGIEHWDSTKSMIDYQTIIRNIANVLVIIMLIGMIFILKK